MGGLLSQPFESILELGLTELIGKDEAVAQNQYSASVGVSLPQARTSGEILQVTLVSRGGDILEPDGVLLVLDADPDVDAADTALAEAARQTVIAQILVETTDWQADANGASATIFVQPAAFHALSTLYFVWFQELATGYNSAAGDDEYLEFNAWIRRDS